MIRDNVDRAMRGRGKRLSQFDKQVFRSNYLTVYDCDEFQAANDEDTIRQILSGRIAYYGLGSEMPPTPNCTKGVAGQRRADELLINRLRETWRALKE